MDDLRVKVISRRFPFDKAVDPGGARYYVTPLRGRVRVHAGFFSTADAAARWAYSAGYDVTGYDFQGAMSR